MISLSDTQRILLSTASQRDSGSLLPLPDTLKPGGGTAKALTALASRGFAEERETSDPAVVRRTDGDLTFGLFVTSTGLAAIGITPEPEAATASASAPKPTRQTKAGAVLALLGREQGATLPELIEATGWLPHTTRAALTGLRKKGHEVTRAKRDGVTCYQVAGQTAQQSSGQAS